MLWDKFKDQFHESYHGKVKKFIESEACDKIYAYLKEEGRRKKLILPHSQNTYRCFKETPLNEVKVILLGYCPYHSLVNGVPAADGLMFSSSLTGKLQPSLLTVYKGLEQDLHNGLNLSYEQTPDLSYLSSQGILLWNSALTTEYLKAGKHQEIWHPFTKFMLEEVFAYTGIPIVFIGKDSEVFKRYVTPLTHGPIFTLEHPSFASRENRDWETKSVFKILTKLIKDQNGYEIKWLKEYE